MIILSTAGHTLICNNSGKKKEKEKNRKKRKKIKKDCILCPRVGLVKAEPIKILPYAPTKINLQVISTLMVEIFIGRTRRAEGLDKELPGGFLCRLFYFLLITWRVCD